MRFTKVLTFSFCFLLLCCGLSFGFSKRKPIQKTKETEEKIKLIAFRDSTLTKLKKDIKTEIEVRYADNGIPTFLKGKLSKQAGKDKVEFALNFLDEYKGLFILKKPKIELKLKSEKMDKAGNTHIRFGQYYQEIPVWGAQLLVHYDRDGCIKLVNGRWESTPQIDVTPLISKDSAFQIAKDELGTDGPWLKDPTSNLFIFTWEKETHLAWQVTLIPDLAHVWIYFVNAKNGNILLKYNDVKFDGPITADGMMVNGNTVSLNAYNLSGFIYLLDATKPMYVPPIDSLKGVIITWDGLYDEDPLNDIVVTDPNADGHFNDAEYLKAAVSAHYYMGQVYDYFYNTFGRNSWDDNGARIEAEVHYGISQNNAFWNGLYMVFGDGDGTQFIPLSGGLDCVAHEFGHAVTQGSGGIIYLGEWGALNEHLSDMWASMIDREDWLIGEDVYSPGTPGDALRDMANPHNGDPFGYMGGGIPAHMSEYKYLPCNGEYDNGGVHINMGIPNKACYLLGTAITKDTTEQLYYQTLCYYLFPKSRFVDLRLGLLQSAEDLYFSEPNYTHIVNSIDYAFDQVGITDFYSVGTDTLVYDDGNAVYFGYIGPGVFFYRWAVRFTPHAPCSLKAVIAQFYSTGSNGWLHIFSDSSYYGIPGTEKLNLNVNRTSVYPNWQTIDISAYGLHFDSDFYVGFSSTTLDSFILLDAARDSNQYNVYVDTLGYEIWHLDSLLSDPLIRAIIKYDQSTDVAEDEEILLPASFVLHQNYPNPFNPSTRIDYYLSQPTEVKITIYNLLGQKVKTLIGQYQTEGSKTVFWDGKDDAGIDVASGVYFYKVVAGAHKTVKKMILLKGSWQSKNPRSGGFIPPL